MLLHDDVVSDGQTKAGTLSGGFGREEGIEHLILNLRWNAGAVVPNPYLHAVAEVLGRGRKSRLIAIATFLFFTPGRRIEAVGDQIQESPRDLLREYVDLASVRIQGPLHIDLEALLLGPCTMIGEIEAVLDERVDGDRPMLAGAFARVQQHVLDDRVCAFAVLHDLVEIAS